MWCMVLVDNSLDLKRDDCNIDSRAFVIGGIVARVVRFFQNSVSELELENHRV